MEILKFPHPALLKPCKPVTVFGPELATILRTMYLVMIQAKGIGLAANQVGIDLRLFVMKDEDQGVWLVNPKIIQQSTHLAYINEGCLSAPGESIDTGNRASWVNVQYQNEDGLIQTRMFGGISAVCVQHEMEHLEGKAFFQSKTITKTKRIRLCKKWGVKFK